MTRKRLRCWTVWLICWLATEANPTPPEEDECLISTDLHIVHFSAFQPAAEGSKAENFQRYCRELPRVGTAYLSIDFVDRDVRRLPIALKVVEEDTQGAVLRTLSELPAKTYPQGVASVQVAFDRVGHYALLLQFQGGELADELRIPITVGLSFVPMWLRVATGTGIGVVVATLSWIGIRARRKPR